MLYYLHRRRVIPGASDEVEGPMTYAQAEHWMNIGMRYHQDYEYWITEAGDD